MFSWFLKLLGIDEDRPASSGNSYLDTNSSSSVTTSTATNTVTDTVPKEESKPEPEEKKEEIVEVPPKAEGTSPEPEPEPEPKASSKSLSDEIPGLKANYIKVLEEAGFTTKVAVDKATDKELLALKGIGKASLKLMRG